MAKSGMMKRLGLNLPEDEETPPYAGPIRPAELTSTGMEFELPEQPEVTAQREEAEEQERFAASPEGRYSAALKAAEEAGPTEEDYRQAAIRRSIAQVGAGMPGYLQQMSTTLFHKPDFSQQAAVAREQARQPDMILTAKEQAQKRLETLAEGARKRALLPGQLKEQEAQVAMSQARMNALKEAAALKAKSSAPASPEDIKKFNDTFGKIGAAVPDDITKGELSQLWKETSDLAIKRGTAFGVAERAAAGKKEVAEIGAEGRKEGKDIKSKEKLVELTVPGIGVARTAEDAKELKTMSAAKKNIEGGLNELQTQYKNLSTKDITKTPKILQNIGQEGKNLVMAYKEFFRLGAPQAAELKFLYSMVDSTPLEIGKNIVSDPVLGTDIQSKLERLKTILNRAMEAQSSQRIRSKDELPPALQSQFYPEQQTPAAATSAAPAAMVDVVAPNGQRGRIPKDKLDAARKKGFKLLGE